MLKSIMTLWLAIGFMPILFVSAAGAMTLDFSCISNNDATNCATGEAQLQALHEDLKLNPLVKMVL